MRLLTLSLLVAALLGAPAATTAGPSGPPNIVVFYLDDVSPHDGRLWSDPNLTPTLHDLFVAHGLEFTNAIGETPFCCPGRADLLTGLHTHNNDVVVNDGRLWHPQMHIGKALKNAGYSSMYIGKYLNQNDKFTPDQWTKHGAGWTHLDAIRGANGKFYNYTVRTKNGPVQYGKVHSTQMVADRTIAHLRTTPASTPVFAVLSVYNMHGPNTPMPQFKNDPRCDSMPPWNSASYNEADMSDKHPVLAARPLHPYANGWPMVKYCREMLGVDWMVKAVTDELEAQGRLDNTLLVFTADNGVSWGQHRLGQSKLTPFAVPVPLLMSWPARWGNAHRTVRDLVSNIDLAPTFCALAGGGCELGPFPTGQDGPDGMSMLPVLDDTTGTVNLGRDAVLESGWNTTDPGGPLYGLPWWHGLRTTPSNPLGRWHYVEYDDGFRELYNLKTDPAELKNVASVPANAALIATLSARLDELFHEGRTAMSFNWPDGSIATSPSGPFKGSDVYYRVGKPAQTQKVTVGPQTTTDFVARVTNHHDAAATFKVRGKATGNSLMTVRYLANNVDVTSKVAGGSFRFQNVPAGGHATLVIRVLSGNAAEGAQKQVDLTVMLNADPVQLDVVRAIAVRGGSSAVPMAPDASATESEPETATPTPAPATPTPAPATPTPAPATPTPQPVQPVIWLSGPP